MVRLIRVGPSTDRLTHGKVYQVIEGRIKDDNGRPMTPCLEQRVMHVYWEYVETTTEKETSTMLTIKTVTLVNGTDANELDIERFLQLIKEEEVKLDYLATFKVKSKAIDKLKAKHEDNIKALLELLDKPE